MAQLETCLKPAVSRRWLFALAGSMWSGVGVMLCRLAYGWLQPLNNLQAMTLTASGALMALLVYRFGFSKLATKNIRRIQQLAERVCLFAFQEWKSYPLVVFMIALGILLRRSAVPKPYLAVLYIGIGGGLLAASTLYYRRLLNPNEACPARVNSIKPNGQLDSEKMQCPEGR
jgi:hypothetical protein